MLKKKTVVSFLIGALAGLIDIIPGVIEGVDFRITMAGYTFWMVIGFIVAHVSLPMKDWLKGLVIAVLLSIPGIMLISVVDPRSVLPMIIITVLLGPIVGHLTGKYAGVDTV